MKKDPVYAVLDIRGLVLHAYHAVRTDPDGEIDDPEQGGDGRVITTPAKAFAAFLDMYMDPILAVYSPKEIVAVWEGGNDYRKGLYPQYKANRDKKPSSLARKAATSEAMALVKNFLAALGILQGSTQGVEADDMVGLLTTRLVGNKTVYTVDADLLWLAGEGPNGNVSVVLAREFVDGTYKGVPLKLIRLQKAILGDSSDNYSGTPGIGEVAWGHMVNEFGFDGMEQIEQCIVNKDYSMMEEALEEGATTDGLKALKKLFEKRRELDFWYHIAGLHPHLCYRGDRKNGKVVRPEWYFRLPSWKRLQDTMARGKAQDLEPRYFRWMPTEVLVTQDNLGDELAKLLEGLSCSPYVAMDFETSDVLQHQPYNEAGKSGGYVDVLNSRVNGVSFTYGDNLQHTVYISINHRDTNNVDKQVIMDVIRRVELAGLTLVIQNEQFERNIIANEFGDDVADSLQPIMDTAIMASYVDENQSAGLKDNSLRNLNYEQTSYKTTIETAKEAAGLAALGDEAKLWQDLPQLIEDKKAEQAAVERQISAFEDAERRALVEAEGDTVLYKPSGDSPLYGTLAAVQRDKDQLTKDMARLKPIYEAGRATVNVMADLTGEQVAHYGCDDSFCTAALAHLFGVIIQLEQQWDLLVQHDMHVAPTLIDSFRAGCAVDYDRLKVMQEEDQIKYEKAMARIRELLAQHCSTIKPHNPDVYIEEVRERQRRALLETGKFGGKAGVAVDAIGLEAKMKEWEQDLRDSTMYRPFVQVRREVEFAPTKTQMAKVIKKLFVQDNPDDPLAPPSDTPSGITKFLTKAPDVLSVAEGRDEEAMQFLELIGPAASQMKARAGEKYEAFANFCKNLLAEDQPLDETGDELNFNSPKQMVQLFYCKLGLPIRDRNKQAADDVWRKRGFPGSPSTGDKAVEMALVEDCLEGDWRREVLMNMRVAKSCMTKESLYYKPWPLWKSPIDGVMHPQIRASATTTRRPTGGSPNLLQVSKKDDGRVRTAVVRRKDDHAMVSADFNGQELRIMTSESLDPVLLDAYIGPKTKDIHTVTASAIAPVLFARQAPKILQWLLENGDGRTVEYEFFNALRKGKNIIDHETGEVIELPGGLEWTLEMVAVLANEVRKVAKAVNFLIIYGGNEVTLARNLSMPKELAKAFIDMVLATYKGITPWQERVVEFAKTHGYVETAYGSRRHISNDIFSSNGAERSRMERQAVNFTIQGCAADILKKVLSDCRKTRLFKDTKSILMAPVYDELFSSVPVPAIPEYCARLQELMNLTPPGHRVPMVAEISVGAYSWGNQKELGSYPSDDDIRRALEETAMPIKEAA